MMATLHPESLSSALPRLCSGSDELPPSQPLVVKAEVPQLATPSFRHANASQYSQSPMSGSLSQTGQLVAPG